MEFLMSGCNGYRGLIGAEDNGGEHATVKLNVLGERVLCKVKNLLADAASHIQARLTAFLNAHRPDIKWEYHQQDSPEYSSKGTKSQRPSKSVLPAMSSATRRGFRV